MVALVTLADVQAELPTVRIAASGTVPTADQVEGYIARIESEIQAYAAARFGPWPESADEDGAQFLRSVILEGVRFLVLRARHGNARSDMLPEEVTLARDAYNDRVKMLDRVLAGVRNVTPIARGGVGVPTFGNTTTAPAASGSFEEWTAAVDDRRGRDQRGSLFRS